VQPARRTLWLRARLRSRRISTENRSASLVAPIVWTPLPASAGILCLTNVAACFLRQALRGLRGFHILAVLAEARFAVAPRTVMECRLSSTDVGCVPFPSFEHRRLQGPPIGKTQLPRQVPHTIHRVEMFGGLLIGLAAREKYN